jgi:PAS domain S-box-containing protein
MKRKLGRNSHSTSAASERGARAKKSKKQTMRKSSGVVGAAPLRHGRSTATMLAARMHRQEILALLSQIALATVDIDVSEFMQEACLFLARTLEADYAKVLQLDPGGQTLTLRAGYGWNKSIMRVGATKFKSNSTIAGLTLTSKHPIIIKDLRREKKLRGFAHLKAHHVTSGMSVIIHGIRGPYGVLGVYSRASRSYSADDLNFLQSVANIMALVFERSDAENELRRFKYMADNANIGISLVDKNGRFHYVNRITYERLGFTKGEYMKKRVVHTPAGSSQSQFRRLFQRAQKQQITQLETLEMRKDGVEIPLEVNLTGVSFEGEPYIFVVSQDISERVRSQAEKLRSQRNLEFLSEASLLVGSSLDFQKNLGKVARKAVSYIADACAIEMADHTGGFASAAIAHREPKKSRLWRASRDEFGGGEGLFGRAPHVAAAGRAELHSHVAPSMLRKWSKSRSHFAALQRLDAASLMIVPVMIGKRVMGTMVFANPSGSRRFDDADLAIVTELANRVALAIENSKLYFEIEEQKERLDNTIANVPGIVWENWVNPDPATQRSNFISDYVEEMTGYGERDWKRPGFMRDILHPEDRDRVLREYDEMVEKKRGMVQHFRLVHKNGGIIWVESHSLAFKDARGRLLGFRGVIMDVSERTELERRKDEFISMASHELKTPVTTLKVFTQILQKKTENAGESITAAYLSKMDAQITRLTDLINDLLDLSKIQTGKLTFKYSDFKIDSLVGEIVEQLQPTTDTHAINVIGRVGRLVHGDRDRIGQVLINLLTNAIKYSPKADKVNIYLSERGGNVIIDVEDFGIGISEEQQSRIFERFYQASEGSRTTFPGLGIGLYISDQIMKRHGGKITVLSEKGKRTVFRVLLPVTAVHEKLTLV